jgi:hypothetical protein
MQRCFDLQEIIIRQTYKNLVLVLELYNNKCSVACSPQANYTERATDACRQS